MKKEEFEKMIKGIDFKPGNLKELKIPWYKKIIMKFFPKTFLKISAQELGISGNKISLACELFENSKVHIEPLSGNSRGFIITLDNKLSLWFNQDGDHFEFDGIEMGQYENGDVTIFDDIKLR